MPVLDRYQKIKEYLMGQQDPEDLKALQAQEEYADEQRGVAGIGSGIDKIISAIGRTQANPEPYMQMQKLAGEGPARVREYLKNKYQQKQEAERLAATMAAGEEAAARADRTEARVAAREAAKGTPAQQELEKEDAKTAAEWNSSGRDSFSAGMKRLEEVKSSLANMEDSVTDKLRARGGESLLSDKQLKVQQDVINAALPTLKATFPGNTSNQELMTHAKSFVDFRLSPAENVKNIEMKMEEARQKAASKEKISQKFGRGSEVSRAPEGHPAAKAAPKLIRVRQKATGQTGSIPEDELTDEYERL